MRLFFDNDVKQCQTYYVMPNDDRKLTLEWVEHPDGVRALVFGAKTWAIFEQAGQK